MEDWDTLMCCGKTFTVAERYEQVDARHWERNLPTDED